MYTKQWSSSSPGHIIFLIDQSGSMSDKWDDNKSKAEQTALVLNRVINDIILTNMSGNKPKDRVRISLIGYGKNKKVLKSGLLSEFANSPLRIDKIKKKVNNIDGDIVSIDEEMPIFIESEYGGGTPMHNAFNLATELISKDDVNNPSPIIINISDGAPNNKKSVENSVEKINSITISDGVPLIFNIHIGNSKNKISFPSKKDELFNDSMAEFLFGISSIVPNSLKEQAQSLDFELTDESRGFIANADIIDLIKFINFGSQSALKDKI